MSPNPSGSAKTALLLEHRGRFANQLWNMIAVYAYCLERGHAFRDYAAIDYHRFFDLPPLPERTAETFMNAWDVLAPRLDLRVFRKRVIRRGAGIVNMRLRAVPPALSRAPKDAPLLSTFSSVFYLPPSEGADPVHAAALAEAEQSASPVMCFRGWLFKNPTGIIKHRARIMAYLKPRAPIAERAAAFARSLRARCEHLVGVHIRQTDYATWLGGKLLVTPKDARIALDELLRRTGRDAKKTLFVVCSDGRVDMSAFAGLDVVRGPGTEIDDFLALTACDVIVGSNSTFGGFASYYGDVPLVILRREGVDWDHYANRKGYFEDPQFIINYLAGSREGVGADGSFFRE